MLAPKNILNNEMCFFLCNVLKKQSAETKGSGHNDHNRGKNIQLMVADDCGNPCLFSNLSLTLASHYKQDC